MVTRDLVYTVGVDASDATSGLRKLESAVRSTMRTVDDELSEGASSGDKFSASIDQIATQMREEFGSAATAAEELQRALRDAGSGLDVGDALNSLRRMGVSFDEITVDADKFAASLKQLDDVRMEGVRDLDSVAPGLASKLDDVSKSADSSKSALANMVGNSTQSLGELAGISGDLGVGIGQIGEYFADATFEGEKFGSVLRSFAGVVGPMAALAAATALVSETMAARGRASAVEEQQVDALTDAYRSGVDPMTAYADALRELGEVQVTTSRNATASEQGGLLGFVGKISDALGPASPLLLIKEADALGLFGKAVEDIAPLLSKAGVSVDVWTKAVNGGQQAYGDLATALSHTTLSADEQKTVLDGLTSSQEANTEAKANAAEITRVFGAETDETTKSVEELAKEQEEAARAADDHAKAISATTQQMLDLDSVFAEIGRRGDALRSLFDLGNAPADAASATRDIAEAIGGLAEAAKGIKLSDALDPSNLGADKLLDALDSLRPQIQAKIADAFAAGGPEAATAVADDYVAQIVAALGGKLSPDKVRELLGITDLSTTLSVAVDMSTLARAKAEIDALVGIGDETPFTAYLKLAVQDESISAAAAHVVAVWGLQEQGVPVKLEPDTDPAAIAEANAFIASYVAANPVQQPIGADTTQALADADDASKAIEKSTTTMPLDADPSKAQTEAQGFKSKTEQTTPVMRVDANTQAAVATVLLLWTLAQRLQPVMTVVADTGPAQSAINGLAQQHPRVGADVYVRDYPTAGEIQQMIGRPRIPVDIVVGQSIRITGVRE